MTRFQSSLLVAGALILYTQFSPLLRYNGVSEAKENLNKLYKQFAELKNNKGISDEKKEIEGTQLQARIAKQQNVVNDAEMDLDKKTSSEIIVTLCLALLLIWLVFWTVPIMYISLTGIAIGVAVYSYLLSAFNLDLLSYDTMTRIFCLCFLVATIMFMGVALHYLFNKSENISLRDAALATNPIAIAAHAKALELQVVSQAQQLAFNRIGQISEGDFSRFDMMKERHINKENWKYDNQTGWNERPVNEPNFQSANNHSTANNGATFTGKGA